MFHGKKIIVVMPAYNAGPTIEKTFKEIPLDLVDEVVVTDDASSDDTVEIARRLGLTTGEVGEMVTAPMSKEACKPYSQTIFVR